MIAFLTDNWFAIGKIIWINILLSGDNAVVIALACRQLHGRDRTLGIALGAGAAILLRIIFTLMIASLLGMPWVKAGGALLLLWVAVKLLVPEEENEDSIKGHSSVWKAVQTVAIADVIMSLDNVLAIAAAANGNTPLIILGLVISVPLVIFGSTILVEIIDRFPALVWAGAGLLGWIAGEIFAEDVGITGLIGHELPSLPFKIGGAVIVLVVGYILRKKHGIAFDGSRQAH